MQVKYALILHWWNIFLFLYIRIIILKCSSFFDNFIISFFFLYTYNQINLIKSHPRFNSENTSFEQEFRLRKKYTTLDVEEFLSDKNFQFFEYLYKENKTTNYRIRCTSDYFLEHNLELLKEKKTSKIMITTIIMMTIIIIIVMVIIILMVMMKN